MWLLWMTRLLAGTSIHWLLWKKNSQCSHRTYATFYAIDLKSNPDLTCSSQNYPCAMPYIQHAYMGLPTLWFDSYCIYFIHRIGNMYKPICNYTYLFFYVPIRLSYHYDRTSAPFPKDPRRAGHRRPSDWRGFDSRLRLWGGTWLTTLWSVTSCFRHFWLRIFNGCITFGWLIWFP